MSIFAPKVRISIYPTDGSGPYKFGKTNDPNDNIISVVVEKKKANPRGTFTFDLVQMPNTPNGKWWHQILLPNDLVVIEMQRIGAAGEAGKMRTAMIGFIDRVMSSENISPEGRVQFVSRITGTDIGKLLTTQYMHFFKYHSYMSQDVLGIFGADRELVQSDFQGKNPAEFIQTYWDGLGSAIWEIEFNTPQGRLRPFDFVKTDLQGIEALVPYSWHIYDREGDLWTLFKSLAEEPIHELYVTMTAPGEGIFGADRVSPLIKLRIPPYTNSGLRINAGEFDAEREIQTVETPSHVMDYGGGRVNLKDGRMPGSAKEQGRGEQSFTFSRDDASPFTGDAYQNTMSRGDQEALTVIQVRPALFTQNGQTSHRYMPLYINPELYKLYGFKELTVYTRLIPDDLRTALEYVETLTRKLTEYFHLNHLYWSGQKTYALRPDIRVGEELIDETAKGGTLRATIEGYKHSWMIGRPSTTTITFSRGVFDREDYDSGQWFMLRLIKSENALNEEEQTEGGQLEQDEDSQDIIDAQGEGHPIDANLSQLTSTDGQHPINSMNNAGSED